MTADAGVGVCGNKLRFASATAAYADAQQLRRQFHCLQRPYYCRSCGGWHLSTTPLPKRRRRVEQRSLLVKVFAVSVDVQGVSFSCDVEANDLLNAEQEVYWLIADRLDDAGRPLRGEQRGRMRELISKRFGVLIRPLSQAELMRRAGQPTLFGGESG